MTSLFSQVRNWLKPSAHSMLARQLYGDCVTAARQPEFFLDLAIEDEISARFELLVAHVALLIACLRAHSSAGHDLAQLVFDQLMIGLDNTLREQGVGDLSVPKKMKPLIAAVYGRLKLWEDLQAGGFPEADLQRALQTTLYAGHESKARPDHLNTLSSYFISCAQHMSKAGTYDNPIALPTMNAILKEAP